MPEPSKKEPKNISFILEQGFTKDIKKWKALKDRVLKYHWDYYSELAYQRSKVSDEIKKSLLEATRKDFKFTRWQRTVKFLYSSEPLSVLGSLKDQAGGRFNIGDINPAEFQPFPALYIAYNRQTSLQEVLCQNTNISKSGLTPLDFALTDRSSISCVSISGQLHTVIDLDNGQTLRPFVDLIKGFKVQKSLVEEAKLLGFPDPNILVTSESMLVQSLLVPNWTVLPMQYDVPSTPQIFGQLVSNAGIDGILYRSKFSSQPCLVVYPQNFDDTTDSYVQLDDAAPKETKITRWDCQTWRKYSNN